MKRLMTLVLALGLVLSSFAVAQATEITAKGSFDFSFGWYSNTNFQDGDQDGENEENFQARQRTRIQVNFVASENVQGVLYFEIGEIEWGNPGDGGDIGTDDVNVETRRAYITFNVPNTELLIQVGLQGLSLPSAVVGSPILGSSGTDLAAAVGIYTINDMVSVGGFWARPYNRDGGWGTDDGANDEMDLVGLFVPVTVDGIMNITPYAMFGSFGSDAMDDLNAPGSGIRSSVKWGLNSLAGLGGAAIPSKDYYTAWWAGFATEFNMLDPLVFMLDVAYGNVDGPEEELDRSGWYLAFEADYKTPWVTPGLIAWWASGEDSDIDDGSERLPTLDANFAPTSFGTDGGDLLNNDDILMQDAAGTWGIGLVFKDISFVEDLTHQVRVVFMNGTNDTEAIKDYLDRGGDPDDLAVGGATPMLTEEDWAWEVDFDTQYQIYENLAAILETGMVNVERESDPWHHNRANNDRLWKTSTAWKLAFGLKYTF